MAATTSTKETVAELQWLSDRISSQVRAIAIGVLAVAWAVLLSPPKDLPISPAAMLWVALVTLVADLLQYVLGYINTRRHHQHLLRENIEEGYDASVPLYRARIGCFWGKQLLAAGAFVGLVYALLPALLSRT